MATGKKKKISLKYKDLILNSTEIQKGPPAVFQLKTETRNIGSITIKRHGEKNLNKNKTILLVGETGAGKSTLVNALVNYAIGVKFQDEICFKIVEETEKSQVNSKTPDVMVYQIFGFEDKTLPYSLTIIDTPGFGNTGGIEHDIVISESLLKLVRSEDEITEMTAVGLVMKATDCRLNDRLMYVFNSVVSLFGKDMEKNIVVLVTNSNGRKPKNALQVLEAANMKCAKDEQNETVHFLFDNCLDEDRTDDVENLEHADKITMKGMKQLMEFLAGINPQKMHMTRSVLIERTRLTACIQNLQDRIKFIELKQNEVQQLQKLLEENKEDMKKKEAVIVEVAETQKVKQPINGGMWLLFFYKGAVTCNVCKENCHYPGCTVAWGPESCEVMKDGRCTVCSGKCPAPVHVKDEWIYVNKTKKVRKTLRDVKVKYEKTKQDGPSESLVFLMKEEMMKLRADKSRLLDEAYQHVVKLEEMALNINAVSTHVHMDFLIEKMKEENDTEKVQSLEKMKNAMDPGVLAALRYMFRSQHNENSH